MQRTLTGKKNNVNFKEYYNQLSFRKAIFFSENTDNPQINCISLNDCYSELFFRMEKTLLSMVLWSAVCHPFLHLTWGSSTNRVAQTTDVMFAILVLINTSNGLTRITNFIIMTSLLIIVTKQTSKEKYRKIMTIKIWSWNLDKL